MPSIHLIFIELHFGKTILMATQFWDYGLLNPSCWTYRCIDQKALGSSDKNWCRKCLFKKGNLPSLGIQKKGVGLSSESFGSRTGSVRTVFPFFCLKSWLLWYSHAFSVTWMEIHSPFDTAHYIYIYIYIHIPYTYTIYIYIYLYCIYMVYIYIYHLLWYSPFSVTWMEIAPWMEMTISSSRVTG